MERPERKRGLSAPEAPAVKSEPGGWTAGEVADYIKFQLSELGGTNGHHDFEQLCFQLTKKRIYPNVIPSTGPVSAGGDQGSDFETFEVGPGGASPYFGKTSDGKVVFACSLEKNYKKKIKADLVSIAGAQPLAKSVKFFSNGAVPVGIRHKLQEYAKTSHGIDLEIFDSLAVSTLLADPEVFWVATRFLSIPSEIFLATPATKSVGWYEEAKGLNVDPNLPRAADFFTIKRAVRYATAHHSLQSDLPSLIEKIRIFHAKQLPEIARRAFYEEFVASLRGLEFVKDCAGGLLEYFGEVPTLTNPAEMEDAAALIHYAVGAQKRGLLDIPMSQILDWRAELMDRIEMLLAEDVSPGRRSSLLDVKAFLTLLEWVTVVAKDEHADVRTLASQSAAHAFAIWRKMLKHVRESPMFPLEVFARRLAALAVEFGERCDYEKLSQETDKLLASRAGKQKIGEQAFERAKAYCKAGRVLEAIDQLHVAHVSSFTRETVGNTVYIPLFLAKLYAEAKLFTAAKYYALASSFAALKIGEDDLRPHIYRGLAEAAASDHANGASLGFFLTLKATVFVASHFSTSGSEKIQDFEWGRLYFYASILTYAASLVSKELADGLANDLLPAVGLGPMYDEALPDVEEFFASYTKYSDLATKATGEGAAPPFGDVPEVRKLSWRQLGIRWNVEWESDYHTTVMAESFIALLQILLTDLRKAELSLFPTQVDLTLKLHSAGLHIEEAPSNERVIRRIFLPKEGISPGLVFGIATTILMVVSAYPQDRFLPIIEQRMKLGLRDKTNPHAPYDVLFREFYLEDDYQALHGLATGSALKVPAFMIETNSGLNGPSGIHSEYEPDKSRQEIENRYRRSSGLLKHTLPRLVKDENFHLTARGASSDS